MDKIIRICFILGLQLFCFGGYSQDIGNSGFESWFIDGLNQHPIGWTSSNDFSLPIGPAGVSADSSSFEGILAARIITTNIGFAGAPYAGFIVNGEMNVTGHYDIDSIYKAGEPFPYKPDALSGYYKYTSDAMIEDWGHAFVLLKKYDSVNQKIDTIGFGSNTLLNPSKNYRYFTVDIEYLKPEITPDSVVVAFFSTYPRSPISGGKLWVDNLAFEYTTGVNNTELSGPMKLYPNPATTVINISGSIPQQIKLYNTKGNEIECIVEEGTVNISSIPPGIYILLAKQGDVWISSKFIKR